MENKNFKTYDEIVQHLDFVEETYNQEKSSLMSSGVEIKGKKSEDVKKEIRNKLIECIKDYECYDRFLRDATTFRRQDFVRFLADYFSIVYGKKYVVLNGICDKKQYYSVISYDLIISESDLNKSVGNNNENKNLDFNVLFDNCLDCCLLLDDSLKFTLLDGKKLSSDFEDFPELIGAARLLVSLKLSHPEMSDQKRLLSVLNNVCIDLSEGNCLVSDGQEYKLEKNYQ